MKNTNCIKTFFRNSKNSLDEYGINSLLYSLGEYKELKTSFYYENGHWNVCDIDKEDLKVYENINYAIIDFAKRISLTEQEESDVYKILISELKNIEEIYQLSFREIYNYAYLIVVNNVKDHGFLETMNNYYNFLKKYVLNDIKMEIEVAELENDLGYNEILFKYINILNLLSKNIKDKKIARNKRMAFMAIIMVIYNSYLEDKNKYNQNRELHVLENNGMNLKYNCENCTNYVVKRLEKINGKITF